MTLAPEAFAFVADLASAIGYLGRAESWTECEALAEWDGPVSCRPLDGSTGGDPVRLLAPRTPDAYAVERQRIMDDMKHAMLAAPERPPTQRTIEKRLDKALCSKRAPSAHAARAPRRRARPRYRRLPGPGMEPAARCP